MRRTLLLKLCVAGFSQGQQSPGLRVEGDDRFSRPFWGLELVQSLRRLLCEEDGEGEVDECQCRLPSRFQVDVHILIAHANRAEEDEEEDEDDDVDASEQRCQPSQPSQPSLLEDLAQHLPHYCYFGPELALTGA